MESIDNFYQNILLLTIYSKFLQNLKFIESSNQFLIHLSPLTEIFGDEFKEDSDFKQIRPNPAFDVHEKNLYLLTHYHVIKVPIGSCALYPDCASCLDSDDPLGCGWCYYGCYYDNKISNDSKCYENQIGFPISWSSCLPIIDKFTPESGSISGRFHVKIQLNVLNYTKISNISVTIAGIECEYKSYNNLIIKCISGAANQEISGNIFFQFIFSNSPFLNSKHDFYHQNRSHKN